MGVLANTLSPQEVTFPTTNVNSTTGGTFTLYTALQWIKLISVVMTYVTVALSTPTVAFQIVDAAGNILWKVTGAALAASLTNVFSIGEGVPLSTTLATNQLLPIPVDMVIPPGGKLQLVATGTTVATDTISAAITWSG